MKTTESQIIHENGKYWVHSGKGKEKGIFTVYKTGLTHSTSDSAYNDKSLAIYRCNYLAKRTIKIEPLTN
jgi:hypothetical protein